MRYLGDTGGGGGGGSDPAWEKITTWGSVGDVNGVVVTSSLTDGLMSYEIDGADTNREDGWNEDPIRRTVNFQSLLSGIDIDAEVLELRIDHDTMPLPATLHSYGHAIGITDGAALGGRTGVGMLIYPSSATQYAGGEMRNANASPTPLLGAGNVPARSFARFWFMPESASAYRIVMSSFTRFSGGGGAVLGGSTIGGVMDPAGIANWLIEAAVPKVSTVAAVTNVTEELTCYFRRMPNTGYPVP